MKFFVKIEKIAERMKNLFNFTIQFHSYEE